MKQTLHSSFSFSTVSDFLLKLMSAVPIGFSLFVKDPVVCNAVQNSNSKANDKPKLRRVPQRQKNRTSQKTQVKHQPFLPFIQYHVFFCFFIHPPAQSFPSFSICAVFKTSTCVLESAISLFITISTALSIGIRSISKNSSSSNLVSPNDSARHA